MVQSRLSKSSFKFVDFKRRYNLTDLYRAFRKRSLALIRFLRNRNTKTVDETFLERLQLAVTEVNGCAVCSYMHTKIA